MTDKEFKQLTIEVDEFLIHGAFSTYTGMSEVTIEFINWYTNLSSSIKYPALDDCYMHNCKLTKEAKQELRKLAAPFFTDLHKALR